MRSILKKSKQNADVIQTEIRAHSEASIVVALPTVTEPQANDHYHNGEPKAKLFVSTTQNQQATDNIEEP